MNTAAQAFDAPAGHAPASTFATNARPQFERVNKELWLVLSLFVIAALLNFAVSSQRMVLGFYTLPTVVSAYLSCRRHATLTALASTLLVVLLRYFNQMGSLCEHKDAQVRELRETCHGILMILRRFISKDKYTENHSYRVSVYATKIAAHLGLDNERVEDIRSAALLHDIGKLDISKQILYKAARLTANEFSEMQKHVEKGIALLEAGRAVTSTNPADRPVSSRQVRRVRIPPGTWRGGPGRGAYHLGR